MAGETVFGGMTGKAEKELRKRKSRLDKMEEEATKLAPDTEPEQWDGRNLMRPDGNFSPESQVSPEGRGRNGY